MAKGYIVRAYGPDGDLAFGATLNCRDDQAAIRRFNDLPFQGRPAELLRGRTVLARNAQAFAGRSASVPNKG